MERVPARQRMNRLALFAASSILGGCGAIAGGMAGVVVSMIDPWIFAALLTLAVCVWAAHRAYRLFRGSCPK